MAFVNDADKAAYDRKYREQNRERINARRRAKYAGDESHRDSVRVSARSRYNPEYQRAYREANRESIRERTRDWMYGLEPGEVARMLSAQSGRCALCFIPAEDAPRGQLVVDHCHDTGKVRALLCKSCNTELGVIEKHRHRLETMIQYADMHKAAEADAQVRAAQEVIRADRK